jgi:hypothetical protein
MICNASASDYQGLTISIHAGTGAVDLGKALARLRNLRALCLDFCIATEEQAVALLPYLAPLSCLRELDLKRVLPHTVSCSCTPVWQCAVVPNLHACMQVLQTRRTWHHDASPHTSVLRRIAVRQFLWHMHDRARGFCSCRCTRCTRRHDTAGAQDSGVTQSIWHKYSLWGLPLPLWRTFFNGLWFYSRGTDVGGGGRDLADDEARAFSGLEPLNTHDS